MKNAFSNQNQIHNVVRTSTFPLNHVNNITTNIGRITPFYCSLVPPKYSGRIPVKVALQTMPMVFPIQTRILAKVSFFKYPLRALWTDYRDYQGNFRTGLVEPYHDFGKISDYSTGSLFDYLGLPTTVASNQYLSNELALSTPCMFQVSDSTTITTEYPVANPGILRQMVQSRAINTFNVRKFPITTVGNNLEVFNGLSEDSISVSNEDVESVDIDPSYYSRFNIAEGVSKETFLNSNITVDLSRHEGRTGYNDYNYVGYVLLDSDGQLLGTDCYNVDSLDVQDSYQFAVSDIVSTEAFTNITDMSGCYLLIFCSFASYDSSKQVSNNQFTLSPVYTYDVFGSIDLPIIGDSVQDVTSSTHCWYSSRDGRYGTNGLKISAYSARAYEGIYNAYFRNIQNDPYYINGQVEYNKFIPTMDGGVDENNYVLHYINWEKDAYTTALQSPQQGTAPLVGLTTYTDYTQVIQNDDGTTTYKQNLAITDEDGKSYGIDFTSDEDGLTDVTYQPLSNEVQLQKSSLIDLATSGISINDLRNVNCYQKYLELNIRAGYSYKEIVQNRFNVKVRYSDLLMPEYLGGFTQEIGMRSVTQVVETSGDGSYAGALGSQAGVGVMSRDSETISVYCDEESIILGLITVVPIPVYSQLLPKHFLYRELLDHFTPEFANIGYQPILNREICPLQCNSLDELNGTFGYQRPWYEYLFAPDVAHGEYRTTMRNFLMQRTFAGPPILGRNFLQVRPEDVNNVWSVTETSDKIYGQIYIGEIAKLPIPRVSIPRLD